LQYYSAKKTAMNSSDQATMEALTNQAKTCNGWMKKTAAFYPDLKIKSGRISSAVTQIATKHPRTNGL
jgi:hypothetical protein